MPLYPNPDDAVSVPIRATPPSGGSALPASPAVQELKARTDFFRAATNLVEDLRSLVNLLVEQGKGR